MDEKAALRATYAANLSLPAMAYPAIDPTDASLMFRTMSANCLRVTGWATSGARAADGASGWRHIASCATGAEGPGLLVDMGVSEDPGTPVAWSGGIVRGIAITEPDTSGFIARITRTAPKPRLMIVSATPAPGFKATARPDPASISDNHLAYAVQWFIFAAAAAVIYVLALRRRGRDGGKVAAGGSGGGSD
jgi:surfeit locus 1 family protein